MDLENWRKCQSLFNDTENGDVGIKITNKHTQNIESPFVRGPIVKDLADFFSI